MSSIETFATEQEVIKRIEELKSEGVDENQITLVAGHDLEAGGTFEAYSGVKMKSSEGSAWDKIVSFFTNDQPEERVAGSLDLTASEEQEFMRSLDSGKILLYVDKQVTVSGQDTGFIGGPGAGAAGADGIRGTGGAGRTDLGAGGLAGALDSDEVRNGKDRSDEGVTSDEELRRLREEENIDEMLGDKK